MAGFTPAMGPNGTNGFIYIVDRMKDMISGGNVFFFRWLSAFPPSRCCGVAVIGIPGQQ
jgi:hypothetical protein